MLYSKNEREYSEAEFKEAYQRIYDNITFNNPAKDGKCAYLLGGQPGAGKSSFYTANEALNEYVIIDGDQYRKYHPHYADIAKYDMENYAERTQSFVNQTVEKLIDDLSSEGYNIIIEGTLRNPDVPISTCNRLNAMGYETNLVIVACDAEEAWKSTMYRAKLMQQMGQKPRFVPIDKYNNIVNSIADNIDRIEREKCFKNINIISRNGELLYREDAAHKAGEIMKSVLNLNNWNNKLMHYIREFLIEKKNVLEKEIEDIRE